MPFFIAVLGMQAVVSQSPVFCGQIQYTGNLYKCIDLWAANSTNGNKIDLYDCMPKSGTPIPGQQWMYDSSTSQIKWIHDQTKCMDLRGGSAVEGNTLDIW
jgi:hypothetical protein